MSKLNILKFLSRSDKWYLGGGNRLIWTPPFPVWLDKLGFWDKANYYNFDLQPVFTVTLLDEDGNEIEISRKKGGTESEMLWTPAWLEQGYEVRWPRQEFRRQMLRLVEHKALLPGDILVSELSIHNPSSKPVAIHLVAWTVQESYPSKEVNYLTDVEYNDGVISFVKNLKVGERPLYRFACAFGIPNVKSYSVNLSEGTTVQPHWHFTPFYEQIVDSKLQVIERRKRTIRLKNECKICGISNDGLVYMALHTQVKLRPRSTETVVAAFAAAKEAEEASVNLKSIFQKSEIRNKKSITSSPQPNIQTAHPIIRRSESNWNDYFSSVPYFKCSDDFLTRYYWYRWYGLRLFTIFGGEGNYKYPAICEGLSYFRAPISYSAQCHMLEMRWAKPAVAQGSLLNFIVNQKADGSFWGYIHVNGYYDGSFYHANWGNSVLELDKIHPDNEFLAHAYAGLARYADYFDRVRDKERSRLYDILNHFETGQEYMSRYMAVEPHADAENWGSVFQMKGVDATVYIYELKKALAKIAEKLGKSDESKKWGEGAEKIKQAVLDLMWDAESEIFSDVDPKTMKRTGIKAATCFYPYFTDIVNEEHLNGLKEHLLNPKEFWTPYPVPSTSVDDALFNPDAEWKGKRHNCPWNGRVWPMTNSHIAEALAQSAIRFNDPLLKSEAVEFINKFIRMMFFDGDVKRPNCFEHYNPFTGKPSIYRGVDDYQHSWVVDLIIKYAAGLRPEEECVIIDPLPFKLDYLVLDNAVIRDANFKILIEKIKFKVWVNGKSVGRSTIGKPLRVEL